MSILRRFDPENRPVFVTCVTVDRQPILLDLIGPLVASYRHLLNLGVRSDAWVVLPDHLHAVIAPGDLSLSDAVHRFKRKLSSVCYQHGHRGRIWQHRFWDHIIREQSDFNRHVDYIHFNPVKHGLAKDPVAWKWSSIHSWVTQGWYQPDWGCAEQASGRMFGE